MDKYRVTKPVYHSVLVQAENSCAGMSWREVYSPPSREGAGEQQ